MGRQKNRAAGEKHGWKKGTRMRMPWIVACIWAFGAFAVYAKYVQTSRYNDAVAAKEFYFSSDLLDGELHEVPALEEDGTAEVTFHLMNHEDQLRYSTLPVSYEVTWENADGENQSTAETENRITGEMSAGKGNDYDTNDEEITISGLEAGNAYRITARSLAPYTKTLTGTVRVQAQDKQVHAVFEDLGNYVEITVWTVDYSGNVVLQCADSLIPDNTDRWMQDAKTGEEQSYEMGANTSHQFRFFKTDGTKTYKCNAVENRIEVTEQ